MLDQLTKLVQEYGQQEIVNNLEIPNEINNAVLAEAAGSVFNGLQNTVADGGLPQLMSLFNGANSSTALANNPITAGISDMFVNNIVKKFGLNSRVAQMIAATVIPMVLSKLLNKAKDPNDNSVNAGSIIDMITGGQMRQQPEAGSGGFGSILSRLGSAAGLDRDGDGDVDFADLTAKTSAAANQAKQQQGGSIMDTIGGLLNQFK